VAIHEKIGKKKEVGKKKGKSRNLTTKSRDEFKTHTKKSRIN
jgi:hypothetical protein